MFLFHGNVTFLSCDIDTVWKVSKYGVFSGPFTVQMRENTDQKNLRIWTLFTQCEFRYFDLCYQLRNLWVMMNVSTYRRIDCYYHCVKSAQIRSYFWSVFSSIQSEYRKLRTRNNSVFGHFSRSVYILNFKSFAYDTWPTNGYSHGQYFTKIFCVIWRKSPKYEPLLIYQLTAIDKNQLGL